MILILRELKAQKFGNQVYLIRLNFRDPTSQYLKAIKYLKEHGKIDRKTYCDICEIEKTVVHEELSDMVKKEIIKMAGKGRGAHCAEGITYNYRQRQSYKVYSKNLGDD